MANLKSALNNVQEQTEWWNYWGIFENKQSVTELNFRNNFVSSAKYNNWKYLRNEQALLTASKSSKGDRYTPWETLGIE